MLRDTTKTYRGRENRRMLVALLDCCDGRAIPRRKNCLNVCRCHSDDENKKDWNLHDDWNR